MIHAGQPTPAPDACLWRITDLPCPDNAIPGGVLCADHLIEHVQRVDLAEHTAAVR